MNANQKIKFGWEAYKKPSDADIITEDLEQARRYLQKAFIHLCKEKERQNKLNKNQKYA